MRHPRNQILTAIKNALDPLEAAGRVERIALSLTSASDAAPTIAIRSENESVERIDSETYARELIAVVTITVHATEEAVTLLDDLTAWIEAYVLPGLNLPDLTVTGLDLAATQFPDLPGENLAAAAVFFRVIYQTPTLN